MEDPFESPRFLLEQVQAGIAEFSERSQILFESRNYNEVIDQDPITGDKTFKIKYSGKVPFKMRHIAVTALNDLRHSLDQIACASFSMATKKDPGKLSFPIARDADHLETLLKSTFPEDLHSVYRSFQPYPQDNEKMPGNAALIALNKAVNKSKHVVSCKAALGVSSVYVDSLVSTGTLEFHSPYWDWDKNELILGTTTKTGDMKFNLKFEPYIAFVGSPTLEHVPVIPALMAFLSQATGVLNDVESAASIYR